jgi:division protein CdvB (Snf7/Vps24/ESCRT-III family)
MIPAQVKVLSNELAEIRKVSRMLGNARMSLEQVQLRLTTIHDLGDAMVAIGPAMSTMKGLKSSLGRFMPEADTELNSMTQTLNGLMVDSFSGDAFNVESEATSEETDKILQEASAVAEQQIGDKFPSVPSLDGLSSPSTTASTSSTYE